MSLSFRIIVKLLETSMVEQNPIAELTNHETNQTDHAQVPGATSPQSFPTPFRIQIEYYPKPPFGG